MQSSVTPEDQAEIVSAIDYSNTKKGKGHRIVVHREAVPSDKLSLDNYKTAPPVLAEPPSCYHELVLAWFYYEKSTTYKKAKTSYFYREFTDGRLSRKAKFGGKGTNLVKFPPKDLEEKEAARIMLKRAFQQNAVDILNET